MTTINTVKSEQEFDFTTIKTEKDAFEKMGMDVAVMPDLSKLPERFGFLTALFILSVVIEAINNGWKADFSNHHQPKYFVYGWVSSSGLVFSDSYYHCDYAVAYAGFPLYVETPEKAKYIFKQFPKLYKAWLLGVPLK